jgi:hypothetical protein
MYGLEPIHVEWHPKTKKERFLTVEERVRLYMSNWYHPPCLNSGEGSDEKDGSLIYQYGGGGSQKHKISTKDDGSLLQVQVFIQEPSQDPSEDDTPPRSNQSKEWDGTAGWIDHESVSGSDNSRKLIAKRRLLSEDPPNIEMGDNNLTRSDAPPDVKLLNPS